MPTAVWVKSNASFLAAASHPDELVEAAAAHGYGAIALTDRHGLYGIVQAHVAAKRHRIRLLIGAELDVNGTPLLLLCPTRGSYARLCRLLSLGHLAAEKGKAAFCVEHIVQAMQADQQIEGAGCVALCPDASLLLRLARQVPSGQLYALAARHECFADKAREQALVRAAEISEVPIVAGPEILYHDPTRRALLDVLYCIDHQLTLEKSGDALRCNASYGLQSVDAFLQRYADVPSWVEAGDALAARCQFTLDELQYRYPAQDLPEGVQQHEHLCARVEEGVKHRFSGRITDALRAQIAQELEIIGSLDYAGYFLSMQDIVRYCHSQNIFCQGRGSAANSAVCYALGITNVDPTRIELLFSRFLSKARAEPPDIDLDIEHHRREEVLQWVYRRYGRSHAAMVANVVRFRWRSALRQVGAVLGLCDGKLDKLASRVGYAGEAHPGAATLPVHWQEFVEEAGFRFDDERVQHLLRLANMLRAFPRHLSVHSGGFVLGSEPINTLCAIEPATAPGRTVLQWDKRDVDALGLFKVDLLGLGALFHIHQTVDEIERTENIRLRLSTIPQEDVATYRMLQRAESIGVFQVESRAQMSMLPRLRPETLYDLVVQVAIVRPGPIQGDMVHPYLLQREKQEPLQYPHEGFAAILDKTFGVPIFQEQVMRLAVMAAHYTPDEADELRRDMAAWRSHSRIEAHRARIVQAMLDAGLDHDFAERLFAQIRGFGEYGFPESHAASFAHIVYATAYLRCHYLAAFICGLLNAQPMGFYAPASIVWDAQRKDLLVLPVCVQKSSWDCRLEAHPQAGRHRFAVRMGLRYVRHMGEPERAHFEATPGPYRSLEEFVRRTKLNQRALRQLARAGALDRLASMAQNEDMPASARRDTLWRLEHLIAARRDALSLPNDGPSAAWQTLLGPLGRHERILWDVVASEHSVVGHPMESLRRTLDQQGHATTCEVLEARNGRFVSCVAQVTCRQRPETAKGIMFITLEDETGALNVIVRPDVQERFSSAAATAGILGVKGRVQARHGSVHLLAHELIAYNQRQTRSA